MGKYLTLAAFGWLTLVTRKRDHEDVLAVT